MWYYGVPWHISASIFSYSPTMGSGCWLLLRLIPWCTAEVLWLQVRVCGGRRRRRRTLAAAQLLLAGSGRRRRTLLCHPQHVNEGLPRCLGVDPAGHMAGERRWRGDHWGALLRGRTMVMRVGICFMKVCFVKVAATSITIQYFGKNIHTPWFYFILLPYKHKPVLYFIKAFMWWTSIKWHIIGKWN